VRNTPEAVLLANTLYDFLDGQIVGKNYKWTESRKYIFFDSANREENMEFADCKLKMGGGPSGRKRGGLPCCNDDFIWGDGQRKAEIKPARSLKGESTWETPLYRILMKVIQGITTD